MNTNITNARRGFRFSLRIKLLILSLALLAVPYLGYEYVRELERYLRANLETSLVDTARAIAGPLHENYRLFPYLSSEPENALFIHTIDLPIQVDGYTDDWINYLGWLDTYHVAADESADPDSRPLSYRLILGQRKQYLYILLQVRDDTVVYHNPGSNQIRDSDQVEMLIGNNYQVTRKYYFSPSAPGRFSPYRIEIITREWEESEYVRYITNITAEWQPDKEGYTLEIAMPLYMADERMGFIVRDVDDRNSRKITGSAGTAGPETETRPGRLVRSSEEISSLLKRFNNVPGRRVWVLDSQGQVLANIGSLTPVVERHPLNLFYNLILPSVSERFKDDLAGSSRLQGSEIQSALAGQTESRWRSSPDNKAVIVSAATPVWIGDDVRGVVVVEETTNNIQLLQRNALISMVNKTLIVFLLITIALLVFATRLSMRLRHLSEEADRSIDEHGRVTGTMTISTATDELGDLSRNYADILERLREYNVYLEGLAGKLSHELRTPMAVVQSSLENLKAELENRDLTYLDRAQEGISRLQNIVTRLSEAARLEQALQEAETSSTDLCKLIRQAVAGYRQAYPDTEFKLEVPNTEIHMPVSAELFMQMLDNIVANAVDFSAGDKPVEIRLGEDQQGILIDIINFGSTLPAEMEDQLFNSMVSLRSEKRSMPHLGLGLYIARLVAEFHRGRIHAFNLADQSGVCFRIRFVQVL